MTSNKSVFQHLCQVPTVSSIPPEISENLCCSWYGKRTAALNELKDDPKMIKQRMILNPVLDGFQHCFILSVILMFLFFSNNDLGNCIL